MIIVCIIIAVIVFVILILSNIIIAGIADEQNEKFLKKYFIDGEKILDFIDDV